MRLSNQFLGVSFLLIFFLTSVYSSETRVSTMGQEGLFLRDQSNVMLFPGTLIQYQDVIVNELRARNTNSTYTIGMHMGYGKTASALYINQPISSVLLNTGISEFGFLLSPLNNAYVFMYGLPLAGFDAGFGLMTAGTSQDNGTIQETAYYLAILAGISNKKMDVGVKVELPSIEQKNGTTVKYSGFGITAQGRMILMTMNGANIFPVGQFSYGSASHDGTNTDFSGLTFRAGVGMEKQINEDNLLVVGVEVFGYESGEEKNKDFNFTTTVSLTTLPAIYVGLESRIASWLVGRIGVRHVNQSRKTESTGAQDIIVDGSGYKTSLGLGMEFGNFLIDFGLNEDVIFDGPNVISGVTNNMASRISITYDFGGEDEE